MAARRAACLQILSIEGRVFENEKRRSHPGFGAQKSRGFGVAGAVRRNSLLLPFNAPTAIQNQAKRLLRLYQC